MRILNFEACARFRKLNVKNKDTCTWYIQCAQSKGRKRQVNNLVISQDGKNKMQK